MTITPIPSSIGMGYDLKAVDASGNEVHTFSIDPVLTLTYPGTPPTGIDYLDAQGGPQQISSTVDVAGHTITATLPHFSPYTSSDTFTVSFVGTVPAAAGGVPVFLTASVHDDTLGQQSEGAPLAVTVAGTATVFSAGCVFGTPNPADYGTDAGGLCPLFALPGSTVGTTLIQATVDGATSNTAVATLTVSGLPGPWIVPVDSSQTMVIVTTDSGGDLKVTRQGTDFTVLAADVANVSNLTVDGSSSTAATTYDLKSIESHFTDPITVKGGSAADTYKLEDGYGNVTIDGATNDKVDLSGDTTPKYDGTNFSDTTSGDSATTGGTTMSIDTSLGTHAADVVTDITTLIGDVATAVNAAASAASAFSTALPLMDPSQGTIAKIVGLTDTLNGIAAKITSAVTSPASLLSGLITQLNSALAALPNVDGLPNPFKGLTLGTTFGTTGTDLAVYLTATLTPNCGTGFACVSKSIPLAFGSRLDSVGIGLTDPAHPGQAPSFTVQAQIGGNVGLGFDATSFTGGPFLQDGGELDLSVDASLSAVNLTVSMGLLSATVSTGGTGFTNTFDVAGSLTLKLVDPNSDGRITASELAEPDTIQVQNLSGTISSPLKLNLTVGAGVTVGGSTPLASAELDISFASDFSAQSVSIFGDGSQPLQVNVQVTQGGGGNLLDTFANNFSSTFSNAGPNDIISMLGQIASFFSSIAGQNFLSTQIPFTSLTLGQVLDFAKQFQHNVLDPLFKSGDATKPDANGDGKVDINDFNFSSIQDLLNRLTNALGLGTPLTANFDPVTGDLTFPFSFDQVFGIGTGASVLPSGVDVVTSAPLGGGTKFALADSGGGNFTISYNGGSAATIPYSATLGTFSSDLSGHGLPGDAVVECANGDTNAAHCPGGPYQVLFDDGTNVIVSPNQVQNVIVGGTGGSFGITNGSQTTAVIANDGTLTLANFKTDLAGIGLGGTVVEVACANGTTSCVGGPFQITYDGAAVQGKAQSALVFNSTNLTDANNLLQVLSLPANTGTFWTAYKNGGALQVSDKIQAGANATDVQNALEGLTALNGHIGSAGVFEVAGDTTDFIVPLTGLTNAAAIAVAGGFSLSFGASLGSLAGVQTTGDIIPLAELTAQATFGINLTSPSTALTAAPAQFQSGPRVDTSTLNQGGHSISAIVVRPGDGSSIGPVQIVTVNGAGGTFTIAGQSFNWGDDGATVSGGLAADGVTSVTLNDANAVGDVYTVNWGAGTAPMHDPVAVSGSGLTNRDEVQEVDVVNADSGSFALGFGGAATSELSFPSVGNPPDATTVSTALNNLPSITGHGSVAVNLNNSVAGHYKITFGGGLGGTDVGDITATDSSQLKGAMSDGNVSGANFSVSVTNEPAVETEIAQNSVSSVGVTTVADGGSSLGVNTSTNGASGTNEVQTITVRANAGAYTLSFGSATTGSIAYNADAATVQGDLAGLAGIGSGNVSVTQASSVGGTVYSITFQGTLAATNVNQLVPTVSTTLGAVNEVQQLSVKGAAGGSYTLSYGGATTAAIAYNAAASDVQNALTAISSIGPGNIGVAPLTITGGTGYTITFQGTLAGANEKPIVATSSLTTQSEIQHVDLLDETGGTFTLSVGGKTSAAIADSAAASSGTGNVQDLLSPVLGAGTYAVTGSAGHYVITFNLGAAHVDQLIGDPGGLENSTVLKTLTITSFSATGGACATTNPNSCPQVVAGQLQTALDNAAISAGLTPGFISQTITNSPSSGVQPYGGGAAPNDQAFEIDITPQNTLTGSGSTGSFTINETSGNFTLTLTNGSMMATTSPLTVGSGAGLVQAAIGVLISALNIANATPNVVQTGSSYTVTFNGGGAPQIHQLSAKVALTGTATIADNTVTGTACTGTTPCTDIGSNLQKALRQTVAAAGLSFQPTVTESSGNISVASGSSMFTFTLVFPSPVVATGSSTGLSLSAPPVQYTFDPNQAAVQVQRHVDVSVASYTDPSFQQLGLASSPTQLVFSTPPSTGIDLTFYVNEQPIPISIKGSDLSGITGTGTGGHVTIDDLIAFLQSQVNSVIADAFNGGELPSGTGITAASYAVTVCRPNINPQGEPCDHIGNRIQFEVLPGSSSKITSLALDVPAFLANGDVNGAITELGFQAITGATQRAKAGTFFLKDVSLGGQADIAIQNLGLTATLGFLGISATATGTETNGLLLHLAASFSLKNPNVASTDAEANTLDLGTLVHAITNGEFFYDSTKAGQCTGACTSTNPPTGFFSGTVQGGFGVALSIKPAGFLAGLGDAL
ncbi:MAG TPA: hypothetical protein VNC40_01565, partial [Gaiellaceae bacterium]|nr:hypothetical protein [Gaiellaceae bacterium]